MGLSAGAPKSIKHFGLHRGRSFTGEEACVFPTSGKLCRGIFSLRRDLAPQRPPQGTEHIFSNTNQCKTERSANQGLGQPVTHQHTDTTRQGKCLVPPLALCFWPGSTCRVELCPQAVACCGPVPSSPRCPHQPFLLTNPAWLCLHWSDLSLGPGSPASDQRNTADTNGLLTLFTEPLPRHSFALCSLPRCPWEPLGPS